MSWSKLRHALVGVALQSACVRRESQSARRAARKWSQTSGLRHAVKRGAYARAENSAAQPTISIETDRNR